MCERIRSLSDDLHASIGERSTAESLLVLWVAVG
jgi:hypothetical protein